MLQIEEWFRRPQRKTERKAAPVTRPASAVHRSEEQRSQAAEKKSKMAARVSEEMAAELAVTTAATAEKIVTESKKTEVVETPKAVELAIPETEAVADIPKRSESAFSAKTVDLLETEKEAELPETKEPVMSEHREPVMLDEVQNAVPEEKQAVMPKAEPDISEVLSDEEQDFYDDAEDIFEPEDPTVWKRRVGRKQPVKSVSSNIQPNKEQTGVSLQDTVAESDEMEHITQKIGMDVSGMIDMEKEDFLLQQIDEFREKAKQLQQLMQSRETRAKELQGVVDEREAQASELDSLINVRRNEADKIMDNVTERIDAMSAGVRNEMSGLSNTVSREVSGLSQNLAHELNQSTEKTRQVVEAATQNMIDQNTRSLEGLKEQLDQLSHLEQIGELSSEMNSQISTLKTDIADKIHAEDVKCYRNIQASMDEQSKLLSEGDEKIRQHIQEQVDSLSVQMGRQSRLVKANLLFTILNFLGVVGILVFLFLF